MVTLRMQADLKLQLGTRLLYACPAMSPEDSRSDAFFKKYSGQEATVVGFTTELVPPLDRRGLPPGVYYDGGFQVRFDGEEIVHEGLRSNHFVVIGPAEIVVGDDSNFVSSLPQEPAFYPLDTVVKADDLLGVQRTVTSVDFDSTGGLICELADTDDMISAKQRREQSEREQAQAERRWLPALSFDSDERVSADQLSLVKRGNVYTLHHNLTRMEFSSVEEELHFWAMDGLSQVVYVNSQWYWTLDHAHMLVSAGTGDLIVEALHPQGTYEVRRIHDQFDVCRKHVRALVGERAVVKATAGHDPFKSLAASIFR